MQTTPTQTNKLHRQLIAGVAVSLALAPAGGPAAPAKDDSVFLLETSVRQHRSPTVAQESFISLRRQTGLHLFFIYGIGHPICRSSLSHNGPKILTDQTLTFNPYSYNFACATTGSPPTTVKVYLDGTAAAAQTLSPGERASVAQDVSKIRNIAIETACTSQSNYCYRVYFFRASPDSSAAPTQNQLERIPPSPRARGQPQPTPPDSPNSPKPGFRNP